MKVLDVFTGYGGFTILALARGWEVVGHSEIDKYANSVLRFNFNIRNYGDISKINSKELPDFDMLVGGSPCQDLSVAGKQKGLTGKRSRLFFHFVRLLVENQPGYFVWENVKGALWSNKGWDFARVQIEMEQAGYNLQWIVLNAKNYGVPQNRERVFVIGTRKGCRQKVLYIKGDSGKNLKQLKSTSSNSQGNRIYGADGISCSLSANGGGLGAKTGLYFIDLCTENSKITSEARTLQARYNKGYSNHSAETSGVCAVVTPNRVNKRQNGRRFKDNEEEMFSLTAQDRHGVLVDGSIRRLTPIECERLMGLPDNWTRWGIDDNGDKVEISDTQRYKMCGNGVVVNQVGFLYKLFDNDEGVN